MIRRLKIAALAILSLLTLTLVLQNTVPVETRLIFTTVTLPAALLLFITATLGFLLGVGVSLFLLRGPRAQQREQSAPASRPEGPQR